MINTIQTEKIVSSVSALQLGAYLKKKGYGICNVTPITDTKQWFAILTKNNEYIIGTVFTGEQGVEKIVEELL